MYMVRSTLLQGTHFRNQGGPHASMVETTFYKISYGEIVSKSRILDSYNNDVQRKLQLYSLQVLNRTTDI